MLILEIAAGVVAGLWLWTALGRWAHSGRVDIPADGWLAPPSKNRATKD